MPDEKPDEQPRREATDREVLQMVLALAACNRAHLVVLHELVFGREYGDKGEIMMREMGAFYSRRWQEEMETLYGQIGGQALQVQLMLAHLGIDAGPLGSGRYPQEGSGSGDASPQSPQE